MRGAHLGTWPLTMPREGNDHGNANFNVSLLLGVPRQLKFAVMNEPNRTADIIVIGAGITGVSRM